MSNFKNSPPVSLILGRAFSIHRREISCANSRVTLSRGVSHQHHQCWPKLTGRVLFSVFQPFCTIYTQFQLLRLSQRQSRTLCGACLFYMSLTANFISLRVCLWVPSGSRLLTVGEPLVPGVPRCDNAADQRNMSCAGADLSFISYDCQRLLLVHGLHTK